MDNKAHYYAYRTHIREQPSYALLPLSNDAVYIDAMIYTEMRFLLLLSKENKEKFQILPKTDRFGNEEKDKRSGELYQERVRIATNYEYYLSNIEDIRFFAESYVINHQEFMEFVEGLYKQDTPTISNEPTSAVAGERV
jgi:hypothetical protein